MGSSVPGLRCMGSSFPGRRLDVFARWLKLSGRFDAAENSAKNARTCATGPGGARAYLLGAAARATLQSTAADSVLRRARTVRRSSPRPRRLRALPAGQTHFPPSLHWLQVGQTLIPTKRSM